MSLSKKDRAADLRLRRTYGITLEEYNQQLKKQNGVCAICGRPPKRLRLAVDHNHKVERTKVELSSYKRFDTIYWIAVACKGVHSKELVSSGTDKAQVIAKVKLELKRRSVRGLLCMICNRKVLGCMERFKVAPERVLNYLLTYDPENVLVNPKQGANV